MEQTCSSPNQIEDCQYLLQVRGDAHYMKRSDHFLREKLNIPANVLEQLIQGAQSDIRQVLNMLSTWKLSRGDMSFDESKSL
jgi:replication-associated recombination protein RarA